MGHRETRGTSFFLLYSLQTANASQLSNATSATCCGRDRGHDQGCESAQATYWVKLSDDFRKLRVPQWMWKPSLLMQVVCLWGRFLGELVST